MEHKETLSDFNDKKHPIEPIWALKSTMPSLIALPFAMFFFTFLYYGEFQAANTSGDHDYRGLIYLGFFILFVPVHFFTNVIKRATFHYGFEGKFLNLKQGLIRREQRQIPFGVIQNVIVKRGILDRLFGLSNVVIQNATPDSTQSVDAQAKGTAGFYGNSIVIPGLRKDNAEELKNALLEHIKHAPTVELGM